jgi:hypothetical protein
LEFFRSNEKDADGDRSTEKLKAGSPRIPEEREVTLLHGSRIIIIIIIMIIIIIFNYALQP